LKLGALYLVLKLPSQIEHLSITSILYKLCINYSPVQSFPMKPGQFSFKKLDWTALQSSPNLFGDRYTVWSYNLKPDCLQISLVHLVYGSSVWSRLATIQSGLDRDLFWRPFKKTGLYNPALWDYSPVPKILDRTVRSSLFMTWKRRPIKRLDRTVWAS